MLKNILTHETCANCRICCSFVKEDAWESPVFREEEMQKIRNRGINSEKFKQFEKDGELFYVADYKFSSDTEILFCPCLDEKDGCILGEEKPFECSIWPVRIFERKNGETYLGLASVCPAFTGEKKEALINELDIGGLREKILTKKKKQNMIKQEEDGYEEI